ncbi:alpha/beta fold hydrolase [Mycetocola reblochoni]|uniref:Hydrolase, alpha/beta fold family n=2 Tax=Mycetocola reblochoni TaxID=331618 RepID=A0A1R4KBH6_9MICO|nr:alpha/beta hydrolase [Mycetocola reblochoni]RLP67930.1 alpha/beta hydrolase [Mycetocola reblochoni]SJN41666.1 hydrolase, alpha/beta fold family [Mycetocola reblochoni REB411]
MIAEARGTGTPIILIHGFEVDHRIMLPLDGALDRDGWRRIYLDLPWAEGAEDTGESTPSQLAEALVDEVRGIIGDGDFAIIGNSFGAVLARHAAHRLAERCLGLATLAGVFRLAHGDRTLPAHQVARRDPGVLESAGAARADFEELSVVQTPHTLRAFERYVLPGLHGADAAVLDRLGENYADGPSPEADAPVFTAPALHVFGRQDQVVGYADGLATVEHYPHGTVVALDGAGHNLHLEHPQLVGALLGDWLDRIEASRSW